MTTSLLRQWIYAELPLETDPQYGFGLTAAEIADRTGWHQGVIYAELCAMEVAHLAIPYRRTEHTPARWIRTQPAPARWIRTQPPHPGTPGESAP